MASSDSASETLDELRARIDALDEKMHELLIERSSVIDALIAAKGTARSRAAFRPQREAEMMRRIEARHSGNLPLATVEHLWREIITTFTYLQAPFRLVVDFGSDPVAMQDVARFAFGFSVELVSAETPRDVVRAVSASGSDLGLIPLADGRAAEPWWRALSAQAGPQLMAIWPFIGGLASPGHSSAAIISPALPDPSTPDLLAFAAADRCELGSAIAGCKVIADAPGDGRREVLLVVDRDDADRILAEAGMEDASAIGGVAAGLTVPASSGGRA